MRILALVAAMASASAVRAEEPRIVTLEIRTLSPISSHHGAGAEIQAELLRPFTRDRDILMPVRSRVFGRIKAAHSVGLGLRRERSSVEIHFTAWEAPDGTRQLLDASPILIDNAREQVDSRGRIQGILAASNPLGIARGLWFRPSLSWLRGPAGFGGSAGTSWMSLPLGPVGASSLLGARLLFTRLPDPEIDLPPGTEMTLQVRCAAADRVWQTLADPLQVSETLSEFLIRQPTTIRKADNSKVADIINVAVLGSQRTVLEAFQAAGWSSTVELNRKSFAQTYRAFTQRHGYAEAPVSKLYYEGRVPDLVFQKSLNSIAKRHHVRLWRLTGPSGEDLWLGAATHDIAVGFDSKNFSLLHKIDANVDRERGKVSGDLNFAGAVRAATLLARELILESSTESDHALAILALQSPVKPRPAIASAPPPKLSRLRKLSRRLVLEGRQYLLRDNPYYLAFAAGRKLTRRSGPRILADTGHPIEPAE